MFKKKFNIQNETMYVHILQHTKIISLLLYAYFLFLKHEKNILRFLNLCKKMHFETQV